MAQNNKRARLNNLGTQAPKSGYNLAKKSKAFTDGKDVSKMNGRNSYALKAQQAGVFEPVAYAIQQYREAHATSTYVEVYAMLVELFPQLFTKKDMPSGNISKIIHSCELWSKAYWCNHKNLLSAVKIRLQDIINDPNTDASVIVNAYDKLSRWDSSNDVSDETDFVINCVYEEVSDTDEDTNE